MRMVMGNVATTEATDFSQAEGAQERREEDTRLACAWLVKMPAFYRASYRTFLRMPRPFTEVEW